MSDTAAALLILPALAALVLVLECSRLGCTHLLSRYRSSRPLKLREPLDGQILSEKA